MVNYTLKLKDLPDKLKAGVETMEPYEWNLLFSKYIDRLIAPFEQKERLDKFLDGESSPKGSPEFQEEKDALIKMASTTTIDKILKKYPVLLLEPALESLVEDTTPDIKKLKLPYPGFFINKKFEYQGGIMMGIYAAEMNQFFYLNLVDIGVNEKDAAELTKMMNDRSKWDDGTNPNMYFMSVYIDVAKQEVNVIMSSIQEVTEDIQKMPKKVAALAKRAMFYAANVASLIEHKVNSKKPDDPKRDVRIIPYYASPAAARAKVTRYSIIRVFGELKDYTKAYNVERRKYTKHDTTTIVRGHWRHLESEKFKAKRGETIWIMPYVKGMDKKLYSRLIKIKE